MPATVLGDSLVHGGFARAPSQLRAGLAGEPKRICFYYALLP